eukprot:TRINITY_DN7081_c0_g1_i1.p2 TRINITY_DN7081_c0_g1~~TRINITY_DN7081_c0_g1_i1.p2  ORF type:complete len:487 (-),score=86.07 TRINITY_DN7081_c0_g1_i1:212-1672(-)
MAHWHSIPGVSNDQSVFTTDFVSGGGGGGGLAVPDTWKDPTARSAAVHRSLPMAIASSAAMEFPDATPTVRFWPSAAEAVALHAAESVGWEDTTVPSWTTSDAGVAGTVWPLTGSTGDGGGNIDNGEQGPDAASTPPWPEAGDPWGPASLLWHSPNGLGGVLWGAPPAAADGDLNKAAGADTPALSLSLATTTSALPTDMWGPGVDVRGAALSAAPPHVVAADVDLPMVPDEDGGEGAATASATAVGGHSRITLADSRNGDSVVNAVVAVVAADAAVTAGTAAAASIRGIAAATASDAAAGATTALGAAGRMAAVSPVDTATGLAAVAPAAPATSPTPCRRPVQPWATHLYPTGLPPQLARRAVAAVAAAGLARPCQPPRRPGAPQPPAGGRVTACAAAPPAPPSPLQQLSLPVPPSRRAQAVRFLLPSPSTAGGVPRPETPMALAAGAVLSEAAAARPSTVALLVARRPVVKARCRRNSRFVRSR